jgi:hypothetical protein
MWCNKGPDRGHHARLMLYILGLIIGTYLARKQFGDTWTVWVACGATWLALFLPLELLIQRWPRA